MAEWCGTVWNVITLGCNFDPHLGNISGNIYLLLNTFTCKLANHLFVIKT